MAQIIRLLTVWLAWLLIGVMPATAVVKGRYRTDLLERIATKTALRQQLDTLSDGEYAEWTSYKSKPLTVIVSEGRVTHIGYTVFTPIQRQGFGIELCNFLERYLLELDIPTNERMTAEERMKTDHVGMLKGDFSQLRSLCNDTTVYINLQTVGDKGYVMSWRRDSTWLCQVAFPVEYDLLIGTNMDERERRLPEELQRIDSVAWDTISPAIANSLAKAWQDNYYTFKGESYLLDNLSASKFYEKDSTGTLQPIFNKLYPIESLANLFTTNLVENDYTIDIRLVKYGFKTDTISLPLRQWTHYCRQTGCKPFFGIISIDDEKAVGELVMHNSLLGYNHIMKLTFPAALFESRQGHISARLNSYVNSSRVKNLFDDTPQPKKK